MTTMTVPGPAPAVLENRLPRHVAFIADGNRRWAKARGTTAEEGYHQGAAAVHRTLEGCRALGIETASVFLMSDRNFPRDPADVAVLVVVVADTVNAASTGPVRVLSSGAVMPLRAPQFLKNAIERAERTTADRTGMSVCLGIGYDGHADITQALQRAAAAPHSASPEQLAVERFLTTAGLPAVDLVVRTSGERRLSGFLLWQAAEHPPAGQCGGAADSGGRAPPVGRVGLRPPWEGPSGTAAPT